MCNLILLLVVLVRFVRSASVNVPLQTQVPPVGQPGSTYSFTFAPATFTPDQSQHDASSLSYQASNLPQWATFDSNGRTISGTPSSTDVGTTEVQIQASEVDDSSTVDSFQLIVTDRQFPNITTPFSSQFVVSNPHMSSVTIVPAADGGPGVQVPQAWSFSIGLVGDTFTSPANCKIYYTATLSDRSPLPDWLVFQPSHMTFDGVTPHDLTQYDQTLFEVVLYGSEMEGYGEVQNSFSFTIDTSGASPPVASDYSQNWDTDPYGLPPLNVTANDPFTFDFHSYDFTNLRIDGEPVSAQGISTVNVNTTGYPWLVYDNSSWCLTGTAPISFLDAKPPSLPLDVITATGNMSDTKEVPLHVTPSMFTSPILTAIYADPTSHISFNLTQFFNGFNMSSFTTRATVNAAFTPPSAGSWLTFSPASYVLSGTVPLSVNYTTVRTVFTATALGTSATSTSSLVISLSGVSPGGSSDNAASVRRRRVLGGVLGTFFALLILVLLFFGWRKVHTMIEERERARFVIDHGIHGDRVAAAVAPAHSEAAEVGGVTEKGETGFPTENGATEEFETIYLTGDGMREVGNGGPSRTASPFSAAAQAAATPSAKVTKGDFFRKLRVISTKSLNNIRRVSGGSRRGRGKENQPPTISRPLPMANAANMGIYQTPPLGPSARLVNPNGPDALDVMNSPLVYNVQPSTSMGSIRASKVPILQPDNGMVMSKSLNSLRGGGQGLTSQASHLNLSEESADTLEGGVDLTSWAPEPSYVWASSKLRAAAKGNRGE